MRIIPGDEVPLTGPVASFETAANDTNYWTREWWNRLPLSVRNGDVEVDKLSDAFSLLRFMDGPGHIAGNVQDILNDMYDGVYTDPHRVPDGAPLRWLSMLLGIKRAVTNEETRARLIGFTQDGRAAVGTRRSISDAARPYLIGDNRLRVRPSKDDPWVIEIFVPSVSIPPEGMDYVARQIQAQGVVPAGHRVQLIAVTSQWDAWEAEVEVSAGWDRVEVNIPRWRDSEARGIIID